jgi:alkylhydroperoxidase/carboxymuconolactone decarboxylase family protein YurZ
MGRQFCKDGGRKMTLTAAQDHLKTRFEEVHGYWNPLWESILTAIPDQFEAYINFSGVPYRSGALAPKTRELISIAIYVAMTLMNEDATRVHIRNALKFGATREEILEVFGICTVLGVHSISHSLPFLVNEMEKTGKQVDLTFSDRAKQVQQTWVNKRGYWPKAFNTLLALEPEFVAAYSNFSDAPRIGGPLDMKTVELICVAIDGSATHLFEGGVRTHGMAAIGHGATLQEVVETLELATVTGLQSMMVGVAILNEEMKRNAH